MVNAIIKNVYKHGEWRIITLKTGEEVMAKVEHEMAVVATNNFDVCMVFLVCDECGEWVPDTEMSFVSKRGCICNDCK